jgi:dihydroflavonol-4-reductase
MSLTSKQFTIDTSKPVAVTGATGYIAGVLVQQLLEQGVTIHASVRDPSKKDHLQYLQDLGEKNPGTIKFFKADLLEEGSFAKCFDGCEIVFHTASPFQLSVDDPQKDLIEPAVKGTKNVLNTVNNTPSVKRVVLTSSIAAIYTDSSESKNNPLNEETWNRTASLKYKPYNLSKTLAEQVAWEMAGSQTQWKLATINPSMVLGPGARFHPSSTSFKLMKSLGDGSMKACPNNGFGVVDVREVATAHIAAAYIPDAKGRHILNAENTGFYEIAKALRSHFPKYPLPSYKMPKTLLWLIGPTMAGTSRKEISNNCEVIPNFDHTKSVQELGIKYRPVAKTAEDMFQQLVDEGVVGKK